MSNIIKSMQYVAVDDKKLIRGLWSSAPVKESAESADVPEEGGPTREEENEAKAIIELKEQIIRDAEAHAQDQLVQAQAEIEEMKAAAMQEIEAWWVKRREEDQQHAEQSRQAGYEQGLGEGRQEAEAAVRGEFAAMLEEARAVLELAHSQKHEIIQESEPFLVDLGVAAAEKIIGRQLALEPDWIKDMISRHLLRRREQGTITLCVSVAQFPHLRNMREELSLAVDSQADLLIVPDSTVGDGGCVIRTAFGSIDARIDTQLAEIKKELRQLAGRSEQPDGDG